MTGQLIVCDDLPALARHAAELVVAGAHSAIARRGRFCLALSGGSTPRALYALLAEREFAGRIAWAAVHAFWGDERCVPPEHADSCYRMAADLLLSRVPIPPEHVHRIRGELDPPSAADLCDAELRAFFGDIPAFDLVLLGMGDDGHTASLFPGSPALDETGRWAAAVEHTTPPPPLVARVTLTVPVFNASRQVVLLVSGAGKAERLREVLHGPYGPHRLPAQAIRPQAGELLWLVDRPAASFLPNRR